jgi:hypothetical protein
MKRLTSTLLLCFVSFSYVHAQTNPWHFGVSTYTNYSTPFYHPEPGSERQAEQWKDIEQPKLSFGVNLFSEYVFTPRLSVSIGLGYLNYGDQVKTESDGFTFPETLDPFYGFLRPTNPVEVPEKTRFIHTTHAIEIPIHVKYSFVNGIYIQSGISALSQFRQTNTVVSTYKDGNTTRETNTDETHDLRNLNIALNTGFGYTFFAASPVNWFVGLNTQYVLFGVMHDVPLNRTFLSAGITTGVRF